MPYDSGYKIGVMIFSPCITRDGILLNEIGTSYKITIFIANQLMCNTTQLITIFRLNIHIKTSNKYEFVGILKYIVLRYRNVKGVYRWISKKQNCFGGHYNKTLHCYFNGELLKKAKM